jgi:hypothetical protein
MPAVPWDLRGGIAKSYDAPAIRRVRCAIEVVAELFSN